MPKHDPLAGLPPLPEGIVLLPRVDTTDMPYATENATPDSSAPDTRDGSTLGAEQGGAATREGAADRAPEAEVPPRHGEAQPLPDSPRVGRPT